MLERDISFKGELGASLHVSVDQSTGKWLNILCNFCQGSSHKRLQLRSGRGLRNL